MRRLPCVQSGRGTSHVERPNPRRGLRQHPPLAEAPVSIRLWPRPQSASAFGRGPSQHPPLAEASVSIRLWPRPQTASAFGSACAASGPSLLALALLDVTMVVTMLAMGSPVFLGLAR